MVASIQKLCKLGSQSAHDAMVSQLRRLVRDPVYNALIHDVDIPDLDGAGGLDAATVQRVFAGLEMSEPTQDPAMAEHQKIRLAAMRTLRPLLSVPPALQSAIEKQSSNSVDPQQSAEHDLVDVPMVCQEYVSGLQQISWPSCAGDSYKAMATRLAANKLGSVANALGAKVFRRQALQGVQIDLERLEEEPEFQILARASSFDDWYTKRVITSKNSTLTPAERIDGWQMQCQDYIHRLDMMLAEITTIQEDIAQSSPSRKPDVDTMNLAKRLRGRVDEALKKLDSFNSKLDQQRAANPNVVNRLQSEITALQDSLRNISTRLTTLENRRPVP